jgi:SRSO17 transposase
VTGYLILDDSTHVKRYAQAMGGQGRHYSSTAGRSMPGHSLFQGVYLVEGCQYALDPQMYIQKSVCEREQRVFRSKVEMALQTVKDFEPLAETQTHVLVDSWYVNKAMWKAVRERGWDLSGGLKANHKLRVLEPSTGKWVWMRLDDFAQDLCAEPFEAALWPSQEGQHVVWAHLIQTRIKKLGACQVLIVRPTADAPASQTRFYITTRLQDTLEQVVDAVAKRWTVETLFADFKELMGSDQYQLRSAEAIRRFWALGLCLYQYLDSIRLRLERLHQRHVTLGETLDWLRQRHADLALRYACDLAVRRTPSMTILALFTPALRPMASVNC